MLLIEWKRPCSVSIGDFYLNPGINEVSEKAWKSALESGYSRGLKAYQENEDLILHKDVENDKPTIAIVNKTYDLKLLERWIDDAKGPLKGAIKKQIEFMTTGREKKEA